jgi:hypothetical protein
MCAACESSTIFVQPVPYTILHPQNASATSSLLVAGADMLIHATKREGPPEGGSSGNTVGFSRPDSEPDAGTAVNDIQGLKRSWVSEEYSAAAADFRIKPPPADEHFHGCCIDLLHDTQAEEGDF